MRVFVWGTVVAISTQVLTADVQKNPYQNIVERNLFALRDPPSQNVAPPTPPPPKILLTGITTILGRKQALMKVQVPARPPQPAKEESYILTEGQRDGEIQVVSIDEAAGSVKVINHGVAQELNFDKDGVKLPKTPVAAAGRPGVRGRIPIPPRPPAGTLPTRQLRLPQRGHIPNPSIRR